MGPTDLQSGDSNVSSILPIDVIIPWTWSRWNVTDGVIQLAWIDRNYNLSNTMTKRLTADKKRKTVLEIWLTNFGLLMSLIYNSRGPRKYYRYLSLGR